MTGSLPNYHKMDSRSACIQGVLKVKVKVKGHVIRALSWILGMSYSVIDGLVTYLLTDDRFFHLDEWWPWRFLYTLYVVSCLNCRLHVQHQGFTLIEYYFDYATASIWKLRHVGMCLTVTVAYSVADHNHVVSVVSVWIKTTNFLYRGRILWYTLNSVVKLVMFGFAAHAPGQLHNDLHNGQLHENLHNVGLV